VGAGHVADLAANTKLPAGWDKPPIHRTEYNCWQCGVFAGQTKVTKRDVAEGWLIEHSQGKAIVVRCPKCPAPKPKAKPASSKCQ
jgi:hypothetical protein